MPLPPYFALHICLYFFAIFILTNAKCVSLSCVSHSSKLTDPKDRVAGTRRPLVRSRGNSVGLVTGTQNGGQSWRLSSQPLGSDTTSR
jgi:hypothetical protein